VVGEAAFARRLQRSGTVVSGLDSFADKMGFADPRALRVREDDADCVAVALQCRYQRVDVRGGLVRGRAVVVGYLWASDLHAIRNACSKLTRMCILGFGRICLCNWVWWNAAAALEGQPASGDVLCSSDSEYECVALAIRWSWPAVHTSLDQHPHWSILLSPCIRTNEPLSLSADGHALATVPAYRALLHTVVVLMAGDEPY
jgi:hypothetical protein